MKRTSCITIAFSFLVSYGIVVPHSAFGASWAAEPCTGVSTSQRGLWFDSPGAGANNEAGFFWLVTDESTNEKCTYHTTAGGPDNISTTDFPTLRVRLAVNDGATFKLEVFSVGFEFCDELVGSITSSGTEDNSGFRTKEVTLPAGHSICAVAITLNDDPDDSPGADAGRAKALIDYIHIRNSSAIGWAESFTAGNP